MSADAKAWRDDDGWHAIHDGECPFVQHDGTAYDLAEVLQDVSACMKTSLAWRIREYENGMGLAGYIADGGGHS